MPTVKNSSAKNALWDAYQNAHPLKHNELLYELKQADLYRHFQTVVSKEGYDLTNASGKLQRIFLKVLPETATLFGLPVDQTVDNNRASNKKQKSKNLDTPTLFDSQ